METFTLNCMSSPDVLKGVVEAGSGISQGLHVCMQNTATVLASSICSTQACRVPSTNSPAWFIF